MRRGTFRTLCAIVFLFLSFTGDSRSLFYSGGALQSVSYTDSQLSFGFFGFFDPTTNAARRVWHASYIGASAGWFGYVTGRKLEMRVGGGGTHPFAVSVDSGSWVTPTTVGSQTDGVLTLFDNGDEATHLVQIRITDGSSNGNAWTFNAGNFLTVTGASPSISFGNFSAKWMITDPAFPGQHLIVPGNRPAGANVVPANNDTGPVTTTYSEGGSIKIRVKASEIWIFTGDGYAFYNIDGGPAIETVLGQSTINYRTWQRVAANLDNTAYHDYVIAPGHLAARTGLGLTLGVMTAGNGSGFAAISATKNSIKLGASGTYGGPNPGQPTSSMELYAAAAALNAIGAAAGHSGAVIADLDSDLAGILALRPGVTLNIAIISQGSNDAGVTPESAFKASYTSVVNKLLVAGVPKVICFGQQLGGLWPAATVDQWIQDVVATFADSRVVYVQTATWTGIESNGGHPTIPGYATMTLYEIPAFAPYFNFLLRRDIGGPANDNTPAFLNQVA